MQIGMEVKTQGKMATYQLRSEVSGEINSAHLGLSTLILDF